MSINSSRYTKGGIENSIPYEEFEDISEYDNGAVASTEVLIPTRHLEMAQYTSEDMLQRDIEKVEKLRLEEVRWFYQSGKKKRWKPFLGCDSISIETEWKSVSRSDTEISRVCVRGGMYEVDVLDRKCYPIYWSSFNLNGVEESVDVIRGTWFYETNFMPLSEDVADRIEAEHIERWKGCSLDEVKTLIGNMVMHSVKFPSCHVDWYSVNDVYIHSDAVSYRALRNIVQRFGASKTSTSGHKLHRGYREDAMNEDSLPPVEHLVFVVHGIGSKPDRHKIVRNTNEFRLTCERVAAKHFAHFTKRVEFLPVEWRSKLVLDNGIVDTLMPRKSLGVRQFLNNSAMDIMYYTSPLYRAEIVDGLRQEISRLHGMFMKRNPDFQGKISVFAHSLGTVIMHDIMTAWSPESLFEEYLNKRNDRTGTELSDLMQTQTDAKLENDLVQIQKAKEKIARLEVRTLSQISSPKGLSFHVENFFCVGSPLAIFLALRGQRPIDSEGTQDCIIPRSVCKRIFNIYHPADPIAYRFEPLVISHYTGIAALQVHSNNAVNKTPYAEMQTKAYSTDTPREMTSVSLRQPSIDSDVTSVDILDMEENLDVKDLAVNFENEDEEETDGGDKNKDPGSPDDNGISPTLVRRESYLKALSGGAYRVGKALWGKARRSSKVQEAPISPDSSMVSEEDGTEMCISSVAIEREGSASSSRSSSPAPKSNKELSPEKKPKADVELQSDFIPSDAMHLEHRLDYELQEGFTESRLGYASLTSHTSYWSNQDVALFVLMQIHPASTMTQSILS